MTYSVGFRAAPAQELAEQFLAHLQDHLCLEGRYRDPGLKRQAHPAEIGAEMVEQVTEILAAIRWDRNTVREFLGCYLTEPKAQVFFDPPPRPLSLARFSAALGKSGLRLDARSQFLFAGERFFINGEQVAVPRAGRAVLRLRADQRTLPPGAVDAETVELLHDWYRCGFLAPA